MSLFDFKKVPVKTRLIYGFVLAALTTFFWYLSSLLFVDSDYGIPSYAIMFIVMFAIGFSTITLKVEKDK
jgi:hypothetical protein